MKTFFLLSSLSVLSLAAEQHVHGPDCDHSAQQKPQAHVHGPDCDHAAEQKPEAHVHGPDCDHSAEQKPQAHVHGPDCDHSAEQKPKPHVHGPDCDHPAEEEAGGGTEILEVNAHARDIIAMRTEIVPDKQKALVETLHGFLITPAQAYESYILPSSGRIELKVTSAQQVKKGDLLFTVEAPAIAELIAQRDDAQATLQKLQADSVTMEQRLHALRNASTRNSDLEEQLRFKKTEIAQQETTLNNLAQRLRFASMGATLINHAERVLLGIHARQDGRISEIELRQGSWAEQGANVLSMIDPRALEISASLYGNEQPQFSEARATIPVDGKQVRVTGKLRLSDQIDATTQSRRLYFSPDSLPEGARPGLLCRLDLYEKADQQQGVAIPDTAIVKVGVDDIVFVKRGEQQYEPVKVSVLSSSRGMSIVAGLQTGHHYVVRGGYELKYLLGTGNKKTGHYHADGTFHEGDSH